VLHQERSARRTGDCEGAIAGEKNAAAGSSALQGGLGTGGPCGPDIVPKNPEPAGEALEHGVREKLRRLGRAGVAERGSYGLLHEAQVG